MRRASSVLDALARRAPSIAHRQTNTGLVDVPLAEIALGDRLVILPHELVPADGVVLEGHGTMDESFLTGEPFEIEKAPGSELISGAINRASALTFRATKLPVDSRYARIMQVMQQAEADRPRMRRIADRLSIWYTPLGIGLALAGWAVSGDPRRFLAVLVIATPCPLLLAIPVAILGAISVAARRGIVLKRPSTLEHLDRCRTVIFDKTGTLTYGKPLLTEVVCSPGWDRAEVLAFAASLETYSKHPLASAVVAAARREEVALREVQRLSEKPGGGLSGDVAGHAVELVGRKIAVERGLPEWGSAHAQGLECFVYLDGRCAAMLRFRDEPRRESAALVGHLGPRHKITKVILLSGDRESEVSYLAKRLGITEVHAGKSPEEKVAIVKRETALAPTLYVGDGINDAPAMMAATAAVALGLHSDVTAESADAVILEASLAKVDEMMHISRRMRRIALQSAVGGIALSLVGMGIAAAGFLAPVAGAVAQEAIDLVAVLNALRVSRPPAELTDF
jgi:heavy metal translocating P-type ATPase